MGCDIHSFLARKTKEEPPEIVVVNPIEGRDYQLFSAMAGVRGDLEPYKPPAGLPAWVSSAKLDPCYVPAPIVVKGVARLYVGDHSYTYYRGPEIFGLLGYAAMNGVPSLELKRTADYIFERISEDGHLLKEYYLIVGFDS